MDVLSKIICADGQLLLFLENQSLNNIDVQIGRVFIGGPISTIYITQHQTRNVVDSYRRQGTRFILGRR